MKLHRFVAAGVGVVALVSPAAADGIWTTVYRGFEVLSTPIGGTSGQRFGRIAVLPQQLGDGYRLEFDRSFGNDAFGRPEVLDLGNAELQLSGSMGLTADFTRRGIPSASLDWNLNNLSYSIRGKSGLQDIEMSGTLAGAQNMEINAFGFYEMALDLSNTNAEIAFEGVIIEGDEDTDFDIGPISIRGNIYYDMFVAALTRLGVDTSDLQAVFPTSPIDRIAEEIQNTLEKQAEGIRARSLGSPEADAWALGFASDISAELDAARNLGPAAGPGPSASSVPEPAAGLLFGLAALALRRR